MRKTKKTCPNTMDGISDNIPGHFKSIYKDLYNCVKDADEIGAIQAEVEEKVTSEALKDVKKVTPEQVKKAAAALKPGKGDPEYSFSSDCLKVDSVLLAEYTAILIRSFLIHNHIPQFLLLSTLVPIIKDKLGSVNVSKNYRSVCITSLILKQIDWITIHLFSSVFSFSNLQFAYQENISANMCTWAVVETANYFIRNDSEVFGCSMDKSKAFDLCKFSILFRKMFKKLSHIFLRLIIFIYVHQFSNISWNSQISSSFTISNGVGQGKILAGYAYCFYCFEFFNILMKSGHGCTINGVYAGAFGYSDDDILLAPSLTSLEIMLGIAKDFNTSHGLKFSTDPDPKKSKTKCIAWLKKQRELPKLELCGNLLPWMDKVIHLGCTITDKSDILKDDMLIKRAKYISRNMELNQELYFAAPESKLMMNEIYNSSWFGSSLYSIFSQDTVRLEASYNRSVKIMMDLPLATHRYLIEPLSDRKHLRKVFVKRFLTMIQSIRKSTKPILKMILSAIEYDATPVTGRNLRSIMLESGKYDISNLNVSDCENITYHTIEEDDKWIIEIIKDILEERETSGLDIEDEAMLEYLCCQ